MERLALLLYADDIVVLANSADGLQRMMKAVERFCKRWRLQVNMGKTKVVEVGVRGVDKGRSVLKGREASGSGRVQVPGHAGGEGWIIEEEQGQDAAQGKAGGGIGVEHASAHDVGQGHDQHVERAGEAAPGVRCGSAQLAQ